MSQTLRRDQVTGLLRIVHEAYEMRPDRDARREHVLRGLCALIGGDTAGLVDFPGAPARGTPGKNLVTCGFSEAEGREAFTIYNSSQGSIRNPALPAIAARAKRAGTAAARREEMIEDRDWYRTEYVSDVRRRWRIDHSLYAVTVGRSGPTIGLAFCRGDGRQPFSEEDRALVEVFAAECQAILGDFPDPLSLLRAELPPRAREVHDLLLRGAAAKDVAAAMCISLHTVNQYTKMVFRKFDVGSRAELLARWLERR